MLAANNRHAFARMLRVVPLALGATTLKEKHADAEDDAKRLSKMVTGMGDEALWLGMTGFGKPATSYQSTNYRYLMLGCTVTGLDCVAVGAAVSPLASSFCVDCVSTAMPGIPRA